ncbi:hypothetical protein [Lysobacter terrae]
MEDAQTSGAEPIAERHIFEDETRVVVDDPAPNAWRYPLLLLVAFAAPNMAHADKARGAYASSVEPCKKQEISKFRSAVFSRTADPKRLWPLVSTILCGTPTSQRGMALLRSHLAKTVRYTEEHFGQEGEIESDVRNVGANEAIGIIAASAKLDRAEISIPTKTSVVIDYINEVCAKRISARYAHKRWTVLELSSQCE